MSNKTNKKKEIPIQNIYYMLSYAYNNLKINENIKIGSNNFKNIYDLFGRILVEGVNNLIKKGFYKEYVNKNEYISNIKGKININSTIKRQTTIYHKLNCEFDEFSEDVLFNRIIKATIFKLIRINDLDKEIKKNLKKLTIFFYNVSDIELNKQVFKSLRWNRNNRYYNLIINICSLIIKFELPDESKKGNIIFKDFVKTFEKEMANLFENFVFNYYKKEFNNLKTHKPKINWNLNDEFQNEGEQYLPIMRTDIVLEKSENKQLIIDTKFYQNILHSFYNTENLYSPNLYQIYSYVKNSQFNGEISGMLLYASVGYELNIQYKIGDNIIYIKTLDLNQDWDNINNRLKEIANF